MERIVKISASLSIALLMLGVAAGVEAQSSSMTLFISSAGSGKGADLGGIDGADKICQALAQAAGAGGHTWRAYLSTQPAGGAAAVNARDRIGKGPWQNAKGETVAQNVDDLHSAKANLTKETLLTEKGQRVNGRGDRDDHVTIARRRTAHGPRRWRTAREAAVSRSARASPNGGRRNDLMPLPEHGRWTVRARERL